MAANFSSFAGTPDVVSDYDAYIHAEAAKCERSSWQNERSMRYKQPQYKHLQYPRKLTTDEPVVLGEESESLGNFQRFEGTVSILKGRIDHTYVTRVE